MFTKPTVLVIGAGASSEFNLPLGSGLRNSIGEMTRFRFDRRSGMISGSSELYQILHQLHRSNLANYVEAGRALSAGIGSYVSVDEALHYFSDKPEIVEVGKLAIAHAIILAEAQCSLQKSREISEGSYEGLYADSWLNELFSMAMSTVRRSEISLVFQNLTIVNFNYDRVVEHYLYHRLRLHDASISPDEAKELVGSLRVIRPYGSIGPLTWQARHDGIDFGDDNFLNAVPKSFASLRTYTEQTDTTNIREEISKAISSASLVVFLGCGYHKQNMDLLTAEQNHDGRRTYATTLGIHHVNNGVIQLDICRSIRCPSANVGLQEMRAGEMLSRLRPSIMNLVG